MIIKDTYLDGVKIITPNLFKDSRGYFFESFKNNLFSKYGLPKNFQQDNEVRSKKNVLRGMHYQLKKPQGKLVRVVHGCIIDVAVDIRIGSPTFGKYFMMELSSKNKKMLYIPEGYAHGYIVTSDDSVVLYKCTNMYDPNDEYGIKWNDKSISIRWNYSKPILSDKDKELPLLKNQKFLPKF